MFTLPGLIRYLASARAQSGYFLSRMMAVVVEIADDRHAHAELVERLGDLRNRRGGLFGVDGDADQLRAGLRQRHHLIHGGRDVGRVGVGHGLDHDGVSAANSNSTNINGHGIAARGRRHSTSKDSIVTNRAGGPKGSGSQSAICLPPTPGGVTIIDPIRTLNWRDALYWRTLELSIFPPKIWANASW